MLAKIQKSIAKGTVKAPPSKSICHRLIIGAALSEGESFIDNVSNCRDCEATVNCLRALGAEIEACGSGLKIKGFDPKLSKPSDTLFCDESGSTLRFLIPLALLSENEVAFSGASRLIERPLGVYEDICRGCNLQFERKENTIKVRGPLRGGEYRLPGNVSSQFITGLLFALSLDSCDSRIILTTEVESRSYIDLTIDAMSVFGVSVLWENDSTLFIKGAQKYRAVNTSVEGDYSGTAFIEAFNLFGGKVEVCGLNSKSLQGDRVYRDFFPLIFNGTPKISIKDCPDLGPILFAVAAACNGAVFTDTKRLKIKESDRAAAMAEELTKFGADIRVLDNSVIIKKSPLQPPTKVLSGHNDHRIVMSLAVLLSLFGGEIEGAEAINKSYEEFFEHIKSLGIKVNLYETR